MVDQDSREGPTSSDEWYWYDKSNLDYWLRHDTWTWRRGFLLMCDIHMDYTRPLDAWYSPVVVEPEDEQVFYQPFSYVALLSEDPIYQLSPIKNPNSAELAHNMQRLEALMRDRGRGDMEIDSEDILARMSKRERAWSTLRTTYDIFMSNPDHVATDKFEVATYKIETAYLLDWAASKRISIPWLKWAEERDLLKAPETETPAVIDTPDRITPSDKRRKEGLIAAISLLRQNDANGKLRNREEFESSMGKASVINHVRKHPKVYPHCAEIRSYADRQTIKDQEPTLTKDFPDFTEAKEIVEEYDRLTANK